MGAISNHNFVQEEYVTLDFEDEWYQAFGEPEWTGVWFVWGNSGSGKTTFCLQLCKEVLRAMQARRKTSRGIFVSLEMGKSKPMQDAWKRAGMIEIKKSIKLVHDETMEQISARLEKDSNLRLVAIDSYQYTKMNFAQFLEFKERHKNKLIIIISQADGKKPKGRAADSVQYDASLKIWVEGHRAFSKGRFIGPNGGMFTIWKEGSELYHGQN